MKILVLTSLYPNASMSAHGIFVENRLRAYLMKYTADVKVIAPVPWFPIRNTYFGKYAEWARAPATEVRSNIEIRHPRYFLPPKIGMTYAPAALERCFQKAIFELLDEGWDFDLIDAHYFYPDGVAAERIARRLNKPIVITARGSDINLIPNYPRPRALVVSAAKSADAVVTVCEALKDELVRLGAPAGNITTLRNGVDLKMFRQHNRQTARSELSVTGPVILSVGHLIDRKGHDLVIEAVSQIAEATLLIAGAGECEKRLRALAAARGVEGRVRFLGAVPHDELARIYSAADVLALASSREGWPNVLLEAMACGTPVVATDVWGAREVVTAPEAGRLVRERTANAFATALKGLLDSPPSRECTRQYAERFSWDETAAGMHKIFHEIQAQKVIAA